MPRWTIALLAATTVSTSTALAQQMEDAIALDAEAPAFSLQGATAGGLITDSVRLEDFAGKTVVLAFFYKARTKG